MNYLTVAVQSVNVNESILNEHSLETGMDELIEMLKLKVRDTEFHGFETVRTDPAFLAKFIRVKDGNVEAALKAIKNYYVYVHRNLKLMNGVKSGDLEHVCNCEAFQVLRGRFEGIKGSLFLISRLLARTFPTLWSRYSQRRNEREIRTVQTHEILLKVATFRFNYWKPNEISLRDMQLATLYLIEMYALDPVNQEHGLALIIDLNGLGFDHLLCATPKELHRILQATMKGIPMKVKGIHLINAPAIVWPVYKLIMTILTEKMRNRLILHRSLQSLHKYFDPEKLPLRLGGTKLDDSNAFERDVIDELLEKNIDYAEYWNPIFLNK